MTNSTPPGSHSVQGSLIQLKKKLISTSGNSIVIRKGTGGNIIRELQIFPKSKIRFLLPIGEKSGEKAFFLAISVKRIALFQLKKKSPIAVFKFDEKVVDHGMVNVLTMGRKREEEDGAGFRMRLIIPLVFRSGTLSKMRLTVHFLESQVVKQKMKCLEELIMNDEELQKCVDLGNNTIFGFYEDTVVRSDGTVTRAGEPSTKKKRRISVVATELWLGNILMATENGSIRVVRVKEMNKKSDSLSIFSEGHCVPPYCTLRCSKPSVIISTENTVIFGTQLGEVHCLNNNLGLIRLHETEGGPINCLKVDENDVHFLWISFESGELRRINWMAPDQNESSIFRQNNVGNHEISDVGVDDTGGTEKENGEVHILINNDKKSEVDPPTKNLINNKRSSTCRKSSTELKCLEAGCHYKTLSANTFIMHLIRNHRTTPALAGIVLRCECGKEALSNEHSRTCHISNFTVVRKNDFGPSRTYADKMTPKCPFTTCKSYPKTIYGYADHLYRSHSTTLNEMRCYLRCGVCRGDYYTRANSYEHIKECKSRFFKLLKIGEEEEKKNETEMDQNADASSSISLTDE